MPEYYCMAGSISPDETGFLLVLYDFKSGVFHCFKVTGSHWVSAMYLLDLNSKTHCFFHFMKPEYLHKHSTFTRIKNNIWVPIYNIWIFSEFCICDLGAFHFTNFYHFINPIFPRNAIKELFLKISKIFPLHHTRAMQHKPINKRGLYSSESQWS